MKAIIGFVGALVLLGVAALAHLNYRAVVRELRNEHGAPETYVPFDSVFDYFGFDYHTDVSSGSSSHAPKPAFSSGVQGNPHLK